MLPLPQARHTGFVAAFYLLRLVSAIRQWHVQNGDGDDCDGKSIGDRFNATGSAESIGFLKASQNDTWTWHIGLAPDPYYGYKQYYWLDTTDSLDLNSENTVLYNICTSLYYGMADLNYDNALKDDGNCEIVIGRDCLNELEDVPPRISPDKEYSCDDLLRNIFTTELLNVV
jgi:hypothetical protein